MQQLGLRSERPSGTTWGAAEAPLDARASRVAESARHRATSVTVALQDRAAFDAQPPVLRSDRLMVLQRLLDILPGGLLVGGDGRVLRESANLVRLLPGDVERRLVYRAAERLASDLATGNGYATPMPSSLTVSFAATSARLETQAARYELRATSLFELVGDQITVVVVECLTCPPLDSAWLQNRYGLTRREIDVTAALARGQRTATIALDLGLSPHTVRRHTERVLAKLGVHSRAAIVDQIRSSRAWS